MTRAEEFEQLRPLLFSIAYRILGSVSEAEDAVQETWLRYQASPVQPRSAKAYLSAAVTRISIDVLRSARVRREQYAGPWLPEPLLTEGTLAADPAERVTLDDTVSYALLVVLETLTPAERTAWVLHDLFGMQFTQIGSVVGRAPAAVRQLAARARKHITARAPRIDVNTAEHRAAVAAFSRASGIPTECRGPKPMSRRF